MQCNRQISVATWRLHTFRQLLASTTQTQLRSTSQASISNPLPQEDIAESRHARPSQQLPQSPLITHPRLQPKVRKRKPTKEDYAPLEYNPWAQALASDTRSCVLTNVRMPRRLMGRWGMVRKPNTEKLFLLPIDLMKDAIGWRPPSTPVKVQKDGIMDEAATSEKDFPELRPVPEVGQKGYASQPMLITMAHLSNPIRRLSLTFERSMNAKKPAVTKLLPFRWRHPQGPFTSREEKNCVWIKDMPSYLLRHMRRDILKKLERSIARIETTKPDGDIWQTFDMQEYSDAALLDGLANLEPFEHMEYGVVLVLSRENSPNKNLSSSLAILPQVQKRVPVFDFTKLLSEDDLVRLRTLDPKFQGSALFFKPNTPAGVELVISLWKLQRYMAE